MDKTSRIFVAGHRGMVGSAIYRRLRQGGYSNLIVRTRQQVDLPDAAAVKSLFESFCTSTIWRMRHCS